MKKSIVAILCILSGTACAQTAGLKPGLWEIKVIRHVMDGNDMSAQLASAQAKMREAMSKMTPERRKQMEGMMGGMSGGGMRMCISQAMAARNEAWFDRDGHCGSSKITRNGNKTDFVVNCSSDGRTTVGSGESILNGDTMSTHVDLTVTDARGHHTISSDTQSTFVGTDCQGIAPLDQLAKGMHGGG